MEYLQWLGQLVRQIGELIPRREIVQHGTIGLKHVRGATIVKVKPGITWYWPFFTIFEVVDISQQTLWLEEQVAETTDGQAVVFRGTITYAVRTDLRSLIKAAVLTSDYEHQIDDEAAAVFCTYVASESFAALGSREEVSAELTEQVQDALDGYGIEVLRANLTSLQRGTPIIVSGTR